MKKPVFCDRLFSYYFRSFASSSKFNFLQKVQVLFAGMIFQTRSRNAIKAGICSDANKK